jgi:hypothetical protein
VVFGRLGVEGRERLDRGRGREQEGVGGGRERLDDARRVGGGGSMERGRGLALGAVRVSSMLE